MTPGLNGLLAPPGDARALAEAIVTLLKDPARRQAMGEAGRARVRAEFGVDRLVEGTLAAYAACRGSGGQGTGS